MSGLERVKSSPPNTRMNTLMSNNAEAFTWTWHPELLLAAWMSASFMLLTLSLVFYHLTKVASIEMSPLISGVFASTLIVAALVILVSAIVPYWTRTGMVLASREPEDPKSVARESNIRIVYCVTTSLMCFVLASIAFSIVTGTIKTYHKTYRRPIEARPSATGNP